MTNSAGHLHEGSQALSRDGRSVVLSRASLLYCNRIAANSEVATANELE